MVHGQIDNELDLWNIFIQQIIKIWSDKKGIWRAFWGGPTECVGLLEPLKEAAKTQAKRF